MKKIIYILLTTALIFSLVACGSSETAAKETTENTPAPTADTLTFELIAGEEGEYGELFTMNKDTEFEETYYIYRVPAGTYTVTNKGQYIAQVTVCSDETIITEDGWEECAEIFYVKALGAGESDTVTIVEGSYVEIHEPAKFDFAVEAN